MQIDRRTVELLQIQYELAMAIGISLEMETMLNHAVSTFLRKLNCTSGCVFIRRNGQYSSTPECSIPRRQRDNRICRHDVETLLRRSEQTGSHFQATELPIQGGNPTSGFYYIFDLPEVGFFVLEKHSVPLDPFVFKSLQPLYDKLASACIACLQKEELTRASRQVEFEHQKLRTVIDNTPIVVFAVDSDGIITLSEGYGLQALGQQPGQVSGLSTFDYFADTPEILDAIRTALNGEPSFRMLDIGRLSFDAYFEPIFKADGEVDGVVGVAHNITDRKVAADTLATVLDTVGEGIITIDSEGTIVMVNREAQTIFGYDDQELLGTNIQMLMPEQYRTAHREGMQRYLTTGEAHVLGQRLELEGLHLDGHVFPLEINIQEAVLNGQSHFTASVRDITRRKEYDRMRDDFVAAVSHELRTPLSSIMGWSETLLSGRPGPLTTDQERFLKIIENSSERLQRLIEEILTVSRIESGTLRLEQAPFLPRVVLKSLREVVAAQLRSKSIVLDIQDDWPDGMELLGDGHRMEQVLANIVSNAIKFSPAQSVIQVTSTSDDSGWHVTVTDEGIGIPSAELSHIFERFYRASSANEAQIPGTGIGLYICKAIVEGHGGSIGIKSESDNGTTVWFSIPK